MTGNRYVHPADKLLEVLDSNPDFLEYYSTSDIERLPVDATVTRLGELGIDASLPPWLNDREDTKPGPAVRILSAIDTMDIECGEDIETRSLPDIKTELGQLGLNYVAGLARIEELFGEEEAEKASHDPVKPLEGKSLPAKRRYIPRWYAVAAAAIVVMVSTPSLMTGWHHATVTRMLANLSDATDRMIASQQTQAEKITNLKSRVETLELELAESRSALLSELMKKDGNSNMLGLATENQLFGLSNRATSMQDRAWSSMGTLIASHRTIPNQSCAIQDMVPFIETVPQNTNATIQMAALTCGDVQQLSEAARAAITSKGVSVGDIKQYALLGGETSDKWKVRIVWQDRPQEMSQAERHGGGARLEFNPKPTATDGFLSWTFRRSFSSAAADRPDLTDRMMGKASNRAVKPTAWANTPTILAGASVTPYLVSQASFNDGTKRLEGLQQAADANVTSAMVELAKYYEWSADQDRTDALAWYRKAAEAGDKEAKTALDRLGG